MAQKCHLLESIPPELRFRIYDYVFDEYHSVIYSIQFHTNELHIRHRFPKRNQFPGANLVKTCRILHTEASPFLYLSAQFNLLLLSDATGRVLFPYQQGRPLRDVYLFLSRIRKVLVQAFPEEPAELEHNLQSLVQIANTLEAAGTRLETWSVEFQVNRAHIELDGFVAGEVVARSRDEMLSRLSHDKVDGIPGNSLAEKLLKCAVINTIGGDD